MIEIEGVDVCSGTEFARYVNSLHTCYHNKWCWMHETCLRPSQHKFYYSWGGDHVGHLLSGKEMGRWLPGEEESVFLADETLESYS